MTEQSKLHPLQPIRRFDVFAETKRLEALAHDEPEDVAKGYGLWIAKIVASRRFGGAPKLSPARAKAPAGPEPPSGSRFRGEAGERFRALSNEPQTDEMFDDEIVARMGLEF